MGASVYLGWNVGANDTANCIGPTVGCGLISFRNAVILVSIFVILGGVLQGKQVMRTIGQGIVTGDLNFMAVLVALVCSGFFVTLATFFRIPTSTSQAIVGGVVGIGLAVGAEVDFSRFIVIAESWVICPVLVMALSFGILHLLGWVMHRFAHRTLYLQNAMGWLTILSSCYVSYSLGANHAGAAVGLIANRWPLHPMLLLFIGGCSIAAGAATYGKKVTDTVGKGITPLDIPAAFAAQVASGLGIHFFSMLGIPISTSSAIVGAVVGVGMVKGVRAVSKRTIATIFIGWVLTPTLTAISGYVLYRTLNLLIK